MAVLLSCEETSKLEAAGPAAHSFLIVQLSKDLQGPQWLHYDQNLCEWAAAKELRKWGELNLTINGRCLATSHPFSPPHHPTRERRKFQSVSVGMMVPPAQSQTADTLTFAVLVGACTSKLTTVNKRQNNSIIFYSM